MVNKNLSEAKAAKNDEFYTQLSEIQAELKHYKDKFIGKTVFCNCDDPFESNFVKYFLMNFNALGLKELIATGFVQETEFKEQNNVYALRVNSTKEYLNNTQTDLDIRGVNQFLATEHESVMIQLEGNWARDENNNIVQIAVKEEYIDEKTSKIKKRTIKQNLYYQAGDFRSDMSIELLKQADIVVTNPPFSLFREYVAQLMKYNKQFLIIGNINAITYKEIFPLLKENKMWIGYKSMNQDMYFNIPDKRKTWLLENKKEGSAYKIINDVVMGRLASACWFTNIDHAKRHQMLSLDLKFTYKGHENIYLKYDNYNAINVDKVNQIPCDYMDVMGVPITFLDKYCPEQFEIVGNEYTLNIDRGRGYIQGKRMYSRLFVRRL